MKNNEIKKEFLFEKTNYIILLIGIAVIALGFLLMSGGGSDDPAVFSEAIFGRPVNFLLSGFSFTLYFGRAGFCVFFTFF